jgi:opacity protein-like surface antigen
MRIPFLLFATAFLGTRAAAHDEESPYYLQFGIGGVFTSDAEDVPGGTIGFDPGFSTGVAVGRSYEISERLTFDADIEAFYQAFKVDEDDINAIASAVDDDAKTFAFMLNGTLDWHFTEQYSVYGGLGVGWAKEIDYSAWDSGNLSISDDDGVAFQARFGFGYNLGGTYDVRLGYRYFQTETLDIDDVVAGTSDELDVAQHSIEAVFRWAL